MEKFLKVAAVCSVLGAITTALLIFLPIAQATSFESQVILYSDSLYTGRLWVFFFHPQFNLLATLGLGVLLYKKTPGLVISGVLFMMIWAVTEAAQQAFIIDAVNQIWRTTYADTEDETLKQVLKTNLIGSYGFQDSMYFLLLYCFGVGSILMGLALCKSDKWGRWIGFTFLFFGVLSLASFVRYYAGVSMLSEMIDACYAWIYTWLQPLARLCVGIWLWKAACSK